MQFKDIVNREIANLATCEQEPIHIPGSIQPHGFLFAINITNLTIEFCSKNTSDFIGLSYEQLLGKELQLIIGEHGIEKFKELITANSVSLTSPLQLTINNSTFSCTVQKGQFYILEFEKVSSENLEVNDIYTQTRQFTTYMQNATTLQSLCQAVAEETQKITGYDRVMIYRFDEDYNGEVFAESCIDSLEPFLGLHYPHTDIPVQARELYVKNLLRIIVDVNYQPVPIYTISDSETTNLDLTYSTLRSVSPIHIEYLKNMGVGATLTISLIHENKLWGLIACHHNSAKYISNATRLAAQLQGYFLTSQILVRQEFEEYAVAKKVNISLENLLLQVFATEQVILDNLVKEKDLLQLANATGVILIIDNKVYSAGKVPGEDEIRKLAYWLNIQGYPTGFNTVNLSEAYAGAVSCPAASGIIFHSMGNGKSDCIIWMRAEALQEVNWAGDPGKAIIKTEKGLSPRKSFELWKEIKKCESVQWKKPELLAAATFAHALQKHVHILFLKKEERRQRILTEKLQEANAELENMNWIGSHDLKEPLRKIQMFASRLLEQDGDENSAFVISSVKRMSESAKRMQTLIADIMSYSSLNHLEEGLSTVNLTDLVNGVILEMHDEIDRRHATITVNSLPVINCYPGLISQLFANLLVNSLKFQKKDLAPQITISCDQVSEVPEQQMLEGPFYKITVADNGIGFHNDFKSSIFKVFTRFHQNTELTGTGVGLALCKKIMQNHNGYISAHSEEDKGTSLYLYFPK